MVFFFKLVAFCTEFNLLAPFFVPQNDNGSPYILLAESPDHLDFLISKMPGSQKQTITVFTSCTVNALVHFFEECYRPVIPQKEEVLNGLKAPELKLGKRSGRGAMNRV